MKKVLSAIILAIATVSTVQAAPRKVNTFEAQMCVMTFEEVARLDPASPTSYYSEGAYIPKNPGSFLPPWMSHQKYKDGKIKFEDETGIPSYNVDHKLKAKLCGALARADEKTL